MDEEIHDVKKINRVGHVERRNYIEIVNKMGEIIIKENWIRRWPKKKCMGVIRRDMRACDVIREWS